MKSVNIYSLENLNDMMSHICSNRICSYDVLKQESIRYTLTKIIRELDDWGKMNILFPGVTNQVYWHQVLSLPFTVLGFNIPSWSRRSKVYKDYWTTINECLNAYLDARNIPYVHVEILLSDEGRSIFIIDDHYYNEKSLSKFEKLATIIDWIAPTGWDPKSTVFTLPETKMYEMFDEIFTR